MNMSANTLLQMQCELHFNMSFPADVVDQNRELAKEKIITPVSVLDGNIYPALGGDFPGNLALSSMQALAANVTGIALPFHDTGFHKLIHNL